MADQPWHWCLPRSTDPQQQRYRGQEAMYGHRDHGSSSGCSRAGGRASNSNSSSCGATAGSWQGDAAAAAGRASDQRSRKHRPSSSLTHHQPQQQGCSGSWHRLAVLLVVLVALLLVGVSPAAAQRTVDISITGPPTAKSASISYTWGLAASVTPPQLNMAFSQPGTVTWVINATRQVAFTGSLTGSIRIVRALGNTASVSWTAVGVSVRQGDRVYLSTNAVCTPGNQFLTQGSSSDPLAQQWATVTCTFAFGPNLGPGATPFSPAGLPPELLGEASPNKVFELAANITLSTGSVEQATGTQSFSFDLAAPAAAAGGAAGIVGECATVRDTWAQVTLPLPLGFTAPTDGVSNPATAAGNPPAMQARVCAPTNFAYVMTIPASQPTQRACGDYAFTAAASVSPINSGQGDITGSQYTRSARASITGCDATPGAPGVAAAPGVPGVPAVPAVPGAPAPVVPPVPVVVPPVVTPPPVITPVIPVVTPVVVPPPVVTPVVTPVIFPPVITPVVVPPPPPVVPQPVVAPVQAPPPAIQPVVVPPPPQAAAAAGQQQPQGAIIAPLAFGAGAAATPAPTAPAGPPPSSSSSSSPGDSSTPTAAPQGPPALASNSSGTVAPDSSNGGAASAPPAKYIAPVLPSAAPQPLAVSITSVGGYQVNRQGSIWSARTSSAPEQLFLRSQSRSRITFTVDYAKAALSSGAYVMGSVTITNPNAQVASVEGLSVAIAGQGSSGSGRSSGGRQNAAPLQAQVDCVSGQANAKSPVAFRVPSGGSVTCTFSTQLPNFNSASDGGSITAAVGSVSLGASAAVSVEGSSSEPTPWAFAPNAVAAAGDCARVTALVTPTNDRLQVVGPADSLSGDMVPAAGKVICSAASYSFAGDFGPIGSKLGRRCGAQAILTATVRPQGVSDTGLSAATSARGTTVVPIDEPGCQKEGSGAAGAAGDDGGSGNPAVQVLKVDVSEQAPTSVTEYSWRVKFAMKPVKDAVKFSENATVKSEVEVTRAISSSTRRLSGVIIIQNPSDRPFTILEVRVNATLNRAAGTPAATPTTTTSSSSSRGDTGGGDGSGSMRGKPRVDRTSGSSDAAGPAPAGSSSSGSSGDSNKRVQAPNSSRGLRRLLQRLQQAISSSSSSGDSSSAAAVAAAAKERAAAADVRSDTLATRQAPPSDTTSDLLNVMLGRAGGPPASRSPGNSGSSSSGGNGRSGSNAPPPAPTTSSSSSRPAAVPSGPSVAATVTCPTNKAGSTALPAANKRGGGSNPSSVSCKFTVTMPAEATLETSGRLQVLVIAAPGSSNSSSNSSGSSSSGRVRGEADFSLKGSKPQTVGSCARVTVAPAAQQLAPNPTNLLRVRPLPAAPQGANSSSSGRNGRQQRNGGGGGAQPPKAPDAEKICDSSTYSYDELVGPISADACGSYQVVSLATAEPEGSSQGAQQVLAAAALAFNGCNSTAAAVPSIAIKDFKAINFTTFTWTLNQTAVTASGVTLIPVTNDSSSSSSSSGGAVSSNGNSSSSSSGGSGGVSSSSSAPSAAASAAAASSSTAAVNVSASAFLSRTAQGVLVIAPQRGARENVTLVTEITRLPGVENGLFGLEGQLVASAPGKEPMDVTGLRVAIARPGDEAPLLIAANCPPPNASSSSNSSSGGSSSRTNGTAAGIVTLPPAPATITCTFNYSSTVATPGLISGVVVLPAAAAASASGSKAASSSSNSSSTADTSSPSFLGATQSFRFGGEGSVTKRNLGECVMAADLSGIEVRVGDDLLIPPVRGRNDIGLPQLWPKDAAGRNVTLLPNPKAAAAKAASGLPDKTRLCDSRTLNTTLTFGPFDSKTCGADSQFFAAARVAPTPLQPKGLTREFVLPLEVPCANGSSSSSSGRHSSKNQTLVMFRPFNSDGQANGGGNGGSSSSAPERGSRANSSSSSSRRRNGGGGRSTRATPPPALPAGNSPTN